MKFDLKQFREEKGHKQYAFAELVGYNQPTLSRMENGEKPVSDKLLNKIEDVFKINLDSYKKYDRNKRGLYLHQESQTDTSTHPEDVQIEHVHSAADEELKKRYLQLLEKKSEIYDRYYALREEHDRTNQELVILHENNRLLKELVADMKEVLKRVSQQPDETNV